MIRLIAKYYKMLELLKEGLPEEIVHIIFEYICYDDEKIEILVDNEIQSEIQRENNILSPHVQVWLY